MKHIAIISSSVREGRLSHRVALFFQKYIEANGLGTAEVLDLKAYNFPLFEERLVNQKNPGKEVLDYADRFVKADGIIIVSPVYNASFPAALKNVIDLLTKEWKGKVVAVSSVTYGTNAGISTIQQLHPLLLRLGAYVVPEAYTALSAETEYDEQGNPQKPEATNKFARSFIDKLFSMIETLGKK